VDDDDIDTGGSRGTSSSPSALVGTWEAVIVIQAGDDVQEWRTRWTFNSNRTCHFTRTTISLAEGIPLTVDRECTYRDQNGTAEVTFTETGATQTLPYSSPDSSRERLIIEGVEYERVS